MDESDSPPVSPPADHSADDPRMRLEAMIRAIAEQTRRAIQETNLGVELSIQAQPALAARRVRTARRHGVAAWVHPTPGNTRH